MLDLSRPAGDIARGLVDQLGQQAFSFVAVRVEEARQASNLQGVRLWRDVASEILCAGEGPASGRSASLWRLMQRIEYYRHRASEVERRAAEASAAWQADIREAAVQWRDLALHAELAAAAEQAPASGHPAGADGGQPAPRP